MEEMNRVADEIEARGLTTLAAGEWELVERNVLSTLGDTFVADEVEFEPVDDPAEIGTYALWKHTGSETFIKLGRTSLSHGEMGWKAKVTIHNTSVTVGINQWDEELAPILDWVVATAEGIDVRALHDDESEAAMAGAQ